MHKHVYLLLTTKHRKLAMHSRCSASIRAGGHVLATGSADGSTIGSTLRSYVLALLGGALSYSREMVSLADTGSG